jgi:hypothetical protein
VEHFREVLALMRGARSWAEFYEILNRSLPRFNETLQLPFYDTKAMERLPLQQIETSAETIKRLGGFDGGNSCGRSATRRHCFF